MFDLKKIFSTLGLPLALVAVIVALLSWLGLDLDSIVAVAVTLVGLQLMGSFLIDALKYAGVINDGSSGKWSAAFNLIALAAVAVWMKFFPAVDIHAVDNQLLEFAKVCIYVFAYITQIVGTKRVHQVAVQNFGIRAFSFSK